MYFQCFRRCWQGGVCIFAGKWNQLLLFSPSLCRYGVLGDHGAISICDITTKHTIRTGPHDIFERFSGLGSSVSATFACFGARTLRMSAPGVALLFAPHQAAHLARARRFLFSLNSANSTFVCAATEDTIYSADEETETWNWKLLRCHTSQKSVSSNTWDEVQHLRMGYCLGAMSAESEGNELWKLWPLVLSIPFEQRLEVEALPGGKWNIVKYIMDIYIYNRYIIISTSTVKTSIRWLWDAARKHGQWRYGVWQPAEWRGS